MILTELSMSMPVSMPLPRLSVEAFNSIHSLTLLEAPLLLHLYLHTVHLRLMQALLQVIPQHMLTMQNHSFLSLFLLLDLSSLFLHRELFRPIASKGLLLALALLLPLQLLLPNPSSLLLEALLDLTREPSLKVQLPRFLELHARRLVCLVNAQHRLMGNLFK
jgi:hypothetical protein